jgi:hypothetical protein
VAARDRWVVEADVGHAAAPDPRPALGNGERPDLAVVGLEGQELALIAVAAQIVDPLRLDRKALRGGMTAHRLVLEERGAAESSAGAPGALGHAVERFERDLVAAFDADERAVGSHAAGLVDGCPYFDCHCSSRRGVGRNLVTRITL